MVHLKNLVQSHLHYHSWSTHETLKWLNSLDDTILNQKTASSYNSINKTIRHLRIAQKFWNEFLQGNSIERFNWTEELQEPSIELKLLLYLTQEFQGIVSNFTEEQLSEKVEFRSPWANNNLERIYYIIHVVNHSTYHRGQIVTMARCLNITEGIPMTEYSIFLGSNMDYL